MTAHRARARQGRHARARTGVGLVGIATRVGVAAVLALAPLAATGLVDPADAAEIRVDSGLGGYRTTSSAAPVLIQVDDPSIPLPRPPDAAIVEADPAYTFTSLGTGPTARALSAMLWPGGLVGDGLPALANEQQYPLKADATFPGSAAENDVTTQPGMRATARGLDVQATASAVDSPAPDVLDVKVARSQSTSTVVKDVAVARAVSHVEDLTLAGGLVHIGQVRSVVEATSDGKKRLSTGSTTVSDLVVGPFTFSVGDRGIQVTGADGMPLPSTADALAMLQMVGITLEAPTQSSADDGTKVTQVAKGLRITVDTLLYREAVNGNVPQIAELGGTLIESIPSLSPEVEDGKKQLYYLFFGTPKVTFVVGAATASSAATLPFDLDLPDIDLGGLDGSLDGDLGGVTDPPALVDGGSPPTTGEVITGEPPVVGSPPTDVPDIPVTAAPGLDTTSAAFSGIGPGAVLGVLLLAGLAAWGLQLLTGLALAGGAATGLVAGACRFGARTGVPDLRLPATGAAP